MARILVGTVPYEGGYFSPIKDPSMPIRFYSDRWIEDDIAHAHGVPLKRERLSRKEFRRMRKAAIANYREGRI